MQLLGREKCDRSAVLPWQSDGLFVVWINVDDVTNESWWWNSEPEPLKDALQHAAKIRRSGWECIVMPAHQNPRPDGRWDNP